MTWCSLALSNTIVQQLDREGSNHKSSMTYNGSSERRCQKIASSKTVVISWLNLMTRVVYLTNKTITKIRKRKFLRMLKKRHNTFTYISQEGLEFWWFEWLIVLRRVEWWDVVVYVQYVQATAQCRVLRDEFLHNHERFEFQNEILSKFKRERETKVSTSVTITVESN